MKPAQALLDLARTDDGTPAVVWTPTLTAAQVTPGDGTWYSVMRLGELIAIATVGDVTGDGVLVLGRASRKLKRRPNRKPNAASAAMCERLARLAIADALEAGQ